MTSESTLSTQRTHLAPASINRLLEALMAYAIDPTQWDTLVTEFERQAENVAGLDPSEFLTHLSHAESLAWQLKSEPVSTSQYAYALLNERGAPIATSENFSGLSDYVWISADALAFAHTESLAELRAGMQRLKTSEQTQALVTLKNPDLPSRFGYLMPEARLPAPLRLAHPNAHTALFIAQDTSTEQLFRVLQTSFALTDAETNVTLKLASGLPLKEAAQALGVSVNTARNQLQAVFDKSGVKRQSDLILVVTQMSVILAATVATEPALKAAEITDRDYPDYRFGIATDGSRLAYRTYGSGDHAVLFFHESVGSSRLLPGTEQWATERGLTIIAPDRPGFGFSDARQNLSLAGIGEDLLHLLDHLQINKASYVGVLAGAAYALHTAAMQPDRVDHVWCVSGRLPSLQDDAELTPLVKVRSQLARQPWMLKSFFNILRNRSSDTLHRRLAKRIYGASEADAALLEANPAILEHLTGSTQQSMAQSTVGIVEEIQLFAADDSPALDELDAPVTVWHGRDDPIAPPESFRARLAQVDHAYREFADCGALLIFKHWQELLDAVSATAQHNLP